MTTTISTARVAWIDAAKGIGIILVVWGHIWLTGQGYTYIYSFHVPLFFFLSGYVANFSDSSIWPLMVKKFRSILIPYFSFSLLTYGYWFLIERYVSGNQSDARLAFINIFLSPGADRYLPHNPALWFLTCLFIVTLLFYPITHIRKPAGILATLLFFSVLGYTLSRWLPGDFPWSADVALTAVVFYGIGFMLKNNAMAGLASGGLRMLLLCCSVAAGYLIAQLNGNVAMAENSYGNYMYFYVGAGLGICSVILLAVFCQKNSLLIFLGQNSLIILGLHFSVKRLVTGLTGKALHISPDQVKGSFFISGIDTMLTILLLLPVIYILRNYFYFMLGKTCRNNPAAYRLQA